MDQSTNAGRGVKSADSSIHDVVVPENRKVASFSSVNTMRMNSFRNQTQHSPWGATPLESENYDEDEFEQPITPIIKTSRLVIADPKQSIKHRKAS